MHLHAKGPVHLRADAIEGDPPGPVAGLDLDIALDHGHRRLDPGQLAQGLGILERQQPFRADNSQRGAHGGDLARIDGDQIGAELGEFGEHKALQALAHGGEEDDGGNAHGDAQAGEKGMQPLGPDGGGDELDLIEDVHAVQCRARASDRIEPGGPAGRQKRKDKAGAQGCAHGGGNGPERRGGLQGRDRTGQ